MLYTVHKAQCFCEVWEVVDRLPYSKDEQNDLIKKISAYKQKASKCGVGCHVMK